MIVGDGVGVMFIAPNSSHPLPACLNGTDGAWYGTKNPIEPAAGRRNAAMMKTPGKPNRNNSILLE